MESSIAVAQIVAGLFQLDDDFMCVNDEAEQLADAIDISPSLHELHNLKGKGPVAGHVYIDTIRELQLECRAAVLVAPTPGTLCQ